MATLNNIRQADWTISAYTPGEVAQGLAAFQQRLETLLWTRKGDAVLRPDLGIDLMSYVDRPIAQALPTLRSEIVRQCELYLPEIEIEKITAETNGAQVTISVYWIPENSTRVETTEVSYFIVS